MARECWWVTTSAYPCWLEQLSRLWASLCPDSQLCYWELETEDQSALEIRSHWAVDQFPRYRAQVQL